jgi:hydroxypyruvate isomerase
MIRLSANLSFLFPELPFLKRFEAAARAGFGAVEFAFAYDVPTRLLRRHLRDNDLDLVLINTPTGDAPGELGLAALPGRERDAAVAFDRALEYAVALDAPLIHYLAGTPPPASSREAVDAVFLGNLGRAADLALRCGRVLTLEPLNPRDRPGYHVQSLGHARALIEAAGRNNLRLQFDLYHCQIIHGDLIRSIEANIGLIGHVQIAGVPDRSEPSCGEVAWATVFARLEALGYPGYIGCEYSPASDTLSGLGWAAPYLHHHPSRTVAP